MADCLMITQNDGTAKPVGVIQGGTSIYTGDLNNLKTSGTYQHTVTSNSNAPALVEVGNIVSLSVIESELGLVTQILYRGNIEIYMRRFYNNSWNGWMAVAQGAKRKIISGTTNENGVLTTANISRAFTNITSAIKLRTGNYTTADFATVTLATDSADALYFFRCEKVDGTALANTQVSIEIQYEEW